MNYNQLTEHERHQIYMLKKAGHKQNETAELLNRSPSTISRELSRNSGLRGYRPKAGPATQQYTAQGGAQGVQAHAADQTRH